MTNSVKKREARDEVEVAEPITLPQGRKIRLSLDVTPEMKEIIDGLAADMGTSQADVLRRAIAVMRVLRKAEKEGESPALVKGDKIVAKLVNF